MSLYTALVQTPPGLQTGYPLTHFLNKAWCSLLCIRVVRSKHEQERMHQVKLTWSAKRVNSSSSLLALLLRHSV